MTLEQFHWKSESGVEITLPHMKQISAGILRQNRNGDELNLLFAVLEGQSDKATLERIDSLTLGDLESLVDEWVKEVNPGESSRSSTS